MGLGRDASQPALQPARPGPSVRRQYARCCWSQFSAPCHWKDPPGCPQVTCVFFTADTAAREVPTAAPICCWSGRQRERHGGSPSLAGCWPGQGQAGFPEEAGPGSLPVVEVLPDVLGQDHHQVIDVVVLVGRDACGGRCREGAVGAQLTRPTHRPPRRRPHLHGSRGRCGW